MKLLPIGLAAAIAFATSPAFADDAAGHWGGRIANSLNVFVQLDKAPDGHWAGRLAVPQQNAALPLEQIAISEEQISFRLAAIGAAFTARWNEQGKAWVGTWNQGGQSVPLSLVRTNVTAAQAKRPQEEAIAARQPDYANAEVTFANAAAKATLAGTFSVPLGKGPFPAVVLVQGSGPLGRDEEIFQHKPFLVLADHLARHGIAVLRYDKRGVGKSTGSYDSATSFDLASDTEAAVRFLRSRPDVDTRRIGIVGHSEGGLIAPLVAARDPELAFIVMLAGPGVRGESILAEQMDRAAKLEGMPADLQAKESALNRSLLASMASQPQLEAAVVKTRQAGADAERKGMAPANVIQERIQKLSTPWMHAFLRHEPGPVLQSVRQPVLALNGERDVQVPPGLDLPPIRAALKDNSRAVVKELPGLNHLFQTAKTGAPAEYFDIEETFAPAALDAVSDWILATTR